MTLFKQITIVLTLFLMCVLGSVMYLNFKTAKDFVQNQLTSNTQDAANSLALSLSSVEDFDDISTMETMINAVFDSGYYAEISLVDTDEKVIITSTNTKSVLGIPDWFIKNVHIEATKVSSQVSSGWYPFGTVYIQSHTGLAYEQLWTTFKEISQTFLLLGVFAFLVLYTLLKIVLASLKGVKEQAEAINNNKFILQEKLPFTSEFKEVVVSMNGMVEKVQTIFEKEATTLKKYHELLYTDPQTKLYNRRYFVLRLTEHLNDDQKENIGIVSFLAFNDLEGLRKKLGYKDFAPILMHFTDLLKHVTSGISNSLVVRMGANDFAIFIPSHHGEFREVLQNVLDDAKTLFQSKEIDTKEFFVNIGTAEFNQGDQQKDILSKADYALSVAKAQDVFRANYIESKRVGEVLSLGKEDWTVEIESALEEKRFIFALQSALDVNDGSIYHREIYLRLKNRAGKLLSAGFFIPMAISLSKNQDLDKYAIEKVKDYIQESAQNYAVNISVEFLKTPGVMYWLDQLLKSFADTKTKLHFEIADNIVHDNLGLCEELALVLEKYGHQIGIDRFSTSDKDLSYLQKIRPAYIKLHKSVLFDIATDSSDSGIWDSLNVLTTSMNIKYIATAVESEEDKQKLYEIGIKYMQGIHISDIELEEGSK